MLELQHQRACRNLPCTRVSSDLQNLFRCQVELLIRNEHNYVIYTYRYCSYACLRDDEKDHGHWCKLKASGVVTITDGDRPRADRDQEVD